ncbi:aminodeoxychorismate synthase component I [Colwellia sp. E2M01]|uniref:aminodeoxychorismate synthase component I n=1 Tax=Colwellia sp. E2M01 TaxID=2841561 RepID=UPI00339DA6B7
MTSERLFSLFSHQPWAMWLDSCESEHVDSRFDIIVWQPIATITTRYNSSQICFFNQYKKQNEKQSKVKTTSTDDPLTLLKNLQAQLFDISSPKHEHLPYLGGALGYLSYDLGRRFETLPSIAEQDINLPDMAMGLYDQAIIFDKVEQCFYLICQEDKRQSIETFIYDALAQKQLHLNNIPKHVKAKTAFQLTSSWQANMTKESYIEKFKQVQEYLLSGDCYQINLAQRFSTSYQGDEFEAYLALRKANKAPFSAFIRLDNSAILSVSPERFLQLSNGKVESKPIKGTMPRSEDPIQDAKNAETLKNSPKDNAENLMIVDLLRNDISRSCEAGTVKVPSLFAIESFPAVHHLVSTVEGVLSPNKHATDLLRGAFPGGSITGAPKIRAMEIIEELEPHRRSVYCGSIGYISNCGTMDTSITIRTLICKKEVCPQEASQQNTDNAPTSTGEIHCWAGGGLVADSTANSEYQETFDKVNCILPVLSKLNQV